MQSAPAKTKDEIKLYPEMLYFGRRINHGVGPQPIYKKLLPDGEPTELSPEPSQKLRNHSPSGFNWGYSGSGPAQTSLALLLDATSNPKTALGYYQQFKWDKVAGWGKKWTLLRSELLEWLRDEQRRELISKLNKN